MSIFFLVWYALWWAGIANAVVERNEITYGDIIICIPMTCPPMAIILTLLIPVVCYDDYKNKIFWKRKERFSLEKEV